MPLGGYSSAIVVRATVHVERYLYDLGLPVLHCVTSNSIVFACARWGQWRSQEFSTGGAYGRSCWFRAPIF